MMIPSRIVCGVLLLSLQLVPALAEDGCDKFAWSLARERTLLAAADKPTVKAGETRASGCCHHAATTAGRSHIRHATRAQSRSSLGSVGDRLRRWKRPGSTRSPVQKPGSMWFRMAAMRSVGSTGRGDFPAYAERAADLAPRRVCS